MIVAVVIYMLCITDIKQVKYILSEILDLIFLYIYI